MVVWRGRAQLHARESDTIGAVASSYTRRAVFRLVALVAVGVGIVAGLELRRQQGAVAATPDAATPNAAAALLSPSAAGDVGRHADDSAPRGVLRETADARGDDAAGDPDARDVGASVTNANDDAHVLYTYPPTGDDGGSESFTPLGFDVQNHTAWVRHEAASPKGLFELLIIDWERGTVDRWTAAEDRLRNLSEQRLPGMPRGYPPAFHPLNGDFVEDLVRYAAIVQATGPHHARAREVQPTFAVAANGSHIVYGARPTDKSDGDWLYVTGPTGAAPRRLDVGLKASYDPTFSPDGKQVAFHGCGRPCEYYLYLTGVDKPAPVRVTAVKDASEPLWSRDGRWVYAVSRGKGGRGGCLFRTNARKAEDSKSLACLPALQRVTFLLDDARDMGLLCGGHDAPDYGATCLGIALPGGDIVRTFSAPDPPTLLSHGITVRSGRASAIAAMDLATAARHEFPSPFPYVLVGSRVDDHGALYALRLRSGRGGFELVRLELRRGLAGAQ